MINIDENVVSEIEQAVKEATVGYDTPTVDESPSIIEADLYELLQNRTTKEYDTQEEFQKHHKEIRTIIIDELKSKKFFRKFSYWLVIGIAISLLLFIYAFIFFKSSTTSLSFLITLTVSVFANLIALIGIIFKYVFSSTKEVTDYASILSDHERTK